MTDLERAKHEAVRIFNQYYLLLFLSDSENVSEECIITVLAIKCALNDVQNTLNANPHSNPFNTDGSSTYAYYLMVKAELEKM